MASSIKLTTEEFIAKAREVHGNKYDYSKVEYKNTNTKVCIICKEHGEFWQTANSHLSGHGCPNCTGNIKKTSKEFIARAHEVHGDKYDYSKVEYKNNSTKVCIICEEHGEFWQLPNNHIKGQGCPKCIGKNLTTEDFIAKAREVHGDKYDYSKSEYINSQTKVCIICPEHGEFYQIPPSHLQGSGCPECAKIERQKQQTMTTEDFIAKAREVHRDKYDYSKVEYINSQTKVCIICPEHGEFWQTPKNHLSGKGCPKCIGKNLTTEDFIAKAREVHGDKYDYSKVEYINSQTKVCIICPEHGEFWQTPSKHMGAKTGCPKCHGRGLTIEDFIAKAREVHGDKYDYSKVEYINSQTKVCIICPEHGEFWQTPPSHLQGSGCPECAKIERQKQQTMTTEDFIAKARKVHGDKYDYSKVEYINAKTKVCIICLKHGEFWQTPNSHLRGKGCLKCVAPNALITTEEFIERAKEVHGDKYDYSKTVYTKSKEKVCIICHEKDKFGKEHGEFWQVAWEHLNGSGCCKCHGKHRMTTEEFIETAKYIHGDKYDYSKTIFSGVDNKVCIICPEHGEFWQVAYHHLNGIGCPNCHGLRKNYKFNLLEEFVDEFHLRDFLMTNDENLIYIILRNIEKIDPKFNPIVNDIDRVLRSDSTNPIEDLKDKYRTIDEDVTVDTVVREINTTSIDDIDLDDDDAVEAFINNTTTTVEKTEPTIERLTRARENEINLINTIEHMLTPEDRQFIKYKFLNDKRRNWMMERDKK